MTLLFGQKYRVVVLKRRAAQMFEVCSYIFEDTPQGNKRLRDYLERLEENTTYKHYETVSFRSRHPYGGLVEAVASAQNVAETRDYLRRYANGGEKTD